MNDFLFQFYRRQIDFSKFFLFHFFPELKSHRKSTFGDVNWNEQPKARFGLLLVFTVLYMETKDEGQRVKL